MGISEVFGSEWQQKYKESVEKKRSKRLDVSGVVKEEIMELVTTKMKPNDPNLYYVRGTDSYHVVLVEAPPELRIRELPWGGKAVSMRWIDRWLGLNFKDDDELAKIKPDEHYIAVGIVKQKLNPVTRQMYFNLDVQGIITMDELEKYKLRQEKQGKEIKEKVEEHKGGE